MGEFLYKLFILFLALDVRLNQILQGFQKADRYIPPLHCLKERNDDPSTGVLGRLWKTKF